MARTMETGSADDGKKPRRPRRSFSDEFKAGAVRLVLDEGKTVGQVARDLDLTSTALAEWVKRARADRTNGRTGLTTEERAELTPWERALLMFPIHTGARAGEQVAFEWGDIDWYNKLVIFRRSSALGRVGPTKSGKDRKVPMTADLQAALKAIKHLRSPLVFCNEDGRPMSKYQLHERLWGTARRAGLREIRWHDTRHSFASQLVMADVPIVPVQQWLVHRRRDALQHSTV